MSGVGFLLIVVVISVAGSLLVWLRNRQPNDPLSSVDEFEREMQALGTTPPAVADGHLEPQPRRRMNTVNIRPQEAGAGSAAEDGTGEGADRPDDDRHDGGSGPMGGRS